MNVLLLFGLILLLLALRQNLVVILFAIAAYIHLVCGAGEVMYIIEDMWNGANKEVLLSIPLFILAGNLMTRGSIARRLIDVAGAITAPLPGGMAAATIVACAIFAAISGSSTVTLLAIGSLMYPAMLKAGYSNLYAMGAVCAGGTLGIIIPPSIPMILYGISTEASITALFTAGIIPGLILAGVFMVHGMIVNRHMPRRRWTREELVGSFARGIGALGLPTIILGGIYSGIMTVTESAAMGLLYALIVEVLVHRELKLRDFYAVAVDTAKILGSLFPILAVVLSLNLLLAQQQVPQSMVQWMTGVVTDKDAFLIGVNILLLIAGCLMDSASAILILSPLLWPLAEAYGVDKIHFGIIVTVNLEIGFLTPPVGLNLIVAMGAFKESFAFICRAAIPFILMMLVVLAFITWVPELSLYLVPDR